MTYRVHQFSDYGSKLCSDKYDGTYQMHNITQKIENKQKTKSHNCLSYFPRKACTACKFEASSSLVQPSYKACLSYKKDLSCHRPKHVEQHIYAKWPQNHIYKVLNIKDELNSTKLFQQYGGVSLISAANATRSVDFSFQAPIINAEVSFTQIQPPLNKHNNKLAPKRVSSAFSYTGAATVKYELDESFDQRAQYYMSEVSYSSNYIDKFCATDDFLLQKLKLKLQNRQQPLHAMIIQVKYLELQFQKVEEQLDDMIYELGG